MRHDPYALIHRIHESDLTPILEREIVASFPLKINPGLVIQIHQIPSYI